MQDEYRNEGYIQMEDVICIHERWCQMLGTTKKTKSIFLIQENALVS